MSDNLFDRQRAALLCLTEAARAREAAEAVLTAAFQAATDKAERDVSRARKAHQTTREKELADLDADHAATVERLEHEFSAEQLAAQRGHDDRRKLLADRFQAAQKSGQTKYDEQVWSHATLLEAGEKAAKDQLDTLQRKAAAGADQVAALWAELAPLLSRGRVSRAEVEFGGELPPPTDDDPINRMNRWLGAAADTLARLRAAKSPAWGSPLRLAVLVPLFALSGAPALALAGPAGAAAVAAGVGLAFGVGAWLLLRWRGKRVTARSGAAAAGQLAEATRAGQLLRDYATNEHAAERRRLHEKHDRDRQRTDEYYRPLLAAQKRQFEEEALRHETDFSAAAERQRRKHSSEARAEDERYRTRQAETEARLGAELGAAERLYAERAAAATGARDAALDRMAGAWSGAAGAAARA
ncbi:MAG: hypothetical protein ACKODX_05185, partial [Gemmata sp.]